MKREPLIQLKYRRSPWRLLVACVLLNRTRGSVAKPVIEELFRHWPTPKSLSGADTDELTALIQPLGLQHQRAMSLVFLSRAYKQRRYTRAQVKRLAGVGDYAADCYEMLVLGDLRIDPDDKELARWRRWAIKNPPPWARYVPISVDVDFVTSAYVDRVNDTTTYCYSVGGFVPPHVHAYRPKNPILAQYIPILPLDSIVAQAASAKKAAAEFKKMKRLLLNGPIPSHSHHPSPPDPILKGIHSF